MADDQAGEQARQMVDPLQAAVDAAERVAQAAVEAARAQASAKVDAVRELASAQLGVDEARRQLAVAERSHATVHRAATRAGWSEEELRKLGYPAPAKRTPGRPGGKSPAVAPSSDGGDRQVPHPDGEVG